MTKITSVKSKALGVMFFLVMASLIGVAAAAAQGAKSSRMPESALGSAFIYQGQLKNNGAPVNGNCDIAFGLYDAASGGSLMSGPITPTVTITNGLFTTPLDFGANTFNGQARWLDLQVRCPSGIGAFTPMTSRQQVTSAPYALYSATAGSVNYQNVIVVAKSGGNYATITDALDSITTASNTNRYLVKVMPGIYTETVTMKPYVDIEGSGELTTKITQVGNATGTVVGASNAELRFLTVENTGGNTSATAIYNSSASPRLVQITAIASGATAGGSSSGVLNISSSPTMLNVTATGSGGIGSLNYGVWNTNSSAPTMTNVTATGFGGAYSYGVINQGSSPMMTDVKASASGATGGNYAVFNNSSSPAMWNVAVTASGGTDTSNYGVYNSSSSPAMTNVTITVSGGQNSFGVYNDYSAPPMTNVLMTISGGGGLSVSTGVAYTGPLSPTMANVIATVSGGTGGSFGVYNSAASLTIQNSTISVSGGYGIYNSAALGSHTVKVSNSQIAGSASTIFNNGPFANYVGASLLDGGAVIAGGGTFTCIFDYNASYVALNANCQ